MKTGARKIKFDTVLDKFSPESGWHFVGVSREIADRFEFAKGSRRVICTLNEVETFPCALMPYDGSFFLMVNKGIRTRLGIEAGDAVTVELQKDKSKYGLPMPPEMQEVLNQDPDGDNLFHSLTAGKQRSILYFVGKIKDVDKRIHTALIFVEHIKQNDGKIIHERLQSELKRPII